MVIANIQEDMSAIDVTVNKLSQYSATNESAIKIGKKAAHVVKEATKSGILNSVAASIAA